MDQTVRSVLTNGTVIAVQPAALDRQGRIDEGRQRALARHSIGAGAGGLVAGTRGVGGERFEAELAFAAEEALRRKPDVESKPPVALVANLSRALEEIAEAQYWRIGLMGDTETTLGSVLDGSKVALVLGSEGDGMRHNVMEHCDVLARLPISPRMESLNISNAAAIALYAVATAGR